MREGGLPDSFQSPQGHYVLLPRFYTALTQGMPFVQTLMMSMEFCNMAVSRPEPLPRIPLLKSSVFTTAETGIPGRACQALKRGPMCYFHLLSGKSLGLGFCLNPLHAGREGGAR